MVNFTVERRPDWYYDAVCSSVDPDLWFPEQEDGRNTTTAAKSICRTCPAVQLCAEYAITRPDLDGVWGGLTDRERKDIRAQRGIAERVEAEAAGRPIYRIHGERDKAIHRESQLGTTARELAEQHGVTISTIRRILSSQRRTERQKRSLPAGAEDLGRDERIRLCHGLGWTDREVSEAVQVSTRTVSRVLARTKVEAVA
jgi:WhiB family transcriptional regulator, redox-sensing transcriptional regulator